jgi:hypothetical protein
MPAWFVGLSSDAITLRSACSWASTPPHIQDPSRRPRDSPSSFLDDGPTSNLIRKILGAVSEFDKAMTVAKLKGARDRVRRARGKCEGRKAYAERKGGRELIVLARQLRGNLDGQSQPLRKIAADLAERGCVTPSGRPYISKFPETDELKSAKQSLEITIHNLESIFFPGMTGVRPNAMQATSYAGTKP